MALEWNVKLAVVVLVAAIQICFGTEHQVGSWVTGTDYKTWAKAAKFTVGDTIKFTYKAGVHNVWELGTRAEYDDCNVSKPIKTYNESNAVVPVSTPGPHFYVCGIPGHCKAGMKFIANVDQSTAAPATGPAPAPKSPSSHWR